MAYRTVVCQLKVTSWPVRHEALTCGTPYQAKMSPWQGCLWARLQVTRHLCHLAGAVHFLAGPSFVPACCMRFPTKGVTRFLKVYSANEQMSDQVEHPVDETAVAMALLLPGACVQCDGHYHVSLPFFISLSDLKVFALCLVSSFTEHTHPSHGTFWSWLFIISKCTSLSSVQHMGSQSSRSSHQGL